MLRKLLLGMALICVPIGAFAQCRLENALAAQELILSFDFHRGDEMRTPPLLMLYGDGRAVIGNGKTITLTQEARGALLGDIFAHDIAAMDSGKMQASAREKIVQADGMVRLGTAHVADGATTFLTLHLPDCRKEITLYAASAAAKNLPENPEITGFYQIERLLMALVLSKD